MQKPALRALLIPVLALLLGFVRPASAESERSGFVECAAALLSLGVASWGVAGMAAVNPANFAAAGTLFQVGGAFLAASGGVALLEAWRQGELASRAEGVGAPSRLLLVDIPAGYDVVFNARAMAIVDGAVTLESQGGSAISNHLHFVIIQPNGTTSSYGAEIQSGAEVTMTFRQIQGDP